MAAAKDQRARPIEDVDDGERCEWDFVGRDREADEQEEEGAQRKECRPAPDRYVQVATRPHLRPDERQADRGAGGNDSHLRPGRLHHKEDDRGRNGEACPLPIGAEGLRHAQHRLSDDRHRGELEAREPAGIEGTAKEEDAITRRDHGDGRGSREAEPGGERASVAGPHQAEAHADLAAGGPRQKLAQRDEIGIGGVVQPAAAHDEGLAEIAEMGDRPAEGGQAQAQEYEKGRPRAGRFGR